MRRNGDAEREGERENIEREGEREKIEREKRIRERVKDEREEVEILSRTCKWHLEMRKGGNQGRAE